MKTDTIKAIKIIGKNKDNLCEENKKINTKRENKTYLTEKERHSLINVQRKKGKKTTNKVLVVASHIENLKKIGEIEKTNATKNANKSSFLISLANKKLNKMLKIPNNIQNNKIINSILIPVTCDKPDITKGDALAYDKGYKPLTETGCTIHPA